MLCQFHWHERNDFPMKPGSRIKICLYSGEILDAVVSAVIPDVRGTMIRAKAGDHVVTVKEEHCSLRENGEMPAMHFCSSRQWCSP
jgi:hypothetical protein